MRIDLSRALQTGGIDPGGLNAIQRILLTTDGTVTDILEAYFREPMKVVPIAQDFAEAAHDYAALHIRRGHGILNREILLQGAVSGHAVLHATTIIVPDRLPPRLRAGLLEQREPIGRLILADKLETYREIKCCERRRAGPLAGMFHLFESAPFLSRTYIVTLGGQQIMQITENFPENGM